MEITPRGLLAGLLLCPIKPRPEAKDRREEDNLEPSGPVSILGTAGQVEGGSLMATGIKREQIIMALVIVGVLAALPLALNPRLRCTVTGGDWVEPAKASRPTFPAPLPPGLSPTEALEELQDRERAFQEYQRQPDFCDY